MATRLTHKEKGFVQDIIKGETGVQAVLNNYDTESYTTAGSIATENLKKPKIQQAIEEALPDELLNEVHREGLYATREYYNKDGEMVGDVADFNARAKYLDMAYKRKGSYAPEKSLTLNVSVEKRTVAAEAITRFLNGNTGYSQE